MANDCHDPKTGRFCSRRSGDTYGRYVRNLTMGMNPVSRKKALMTELKRQNKLLRKQSALASPRRK